MSNETVLLLWQFISAVAIPHVIQFLKGQKWFPLANFNNGTLNRLFSWTVAAFTGLGLGISFDRNAGIFSITGLTVAGLIAGMTHMFAQVAANHVTYKVLVAPPQSGVQQAINRDAGTPNAVAVIPAPLPPPPSVGAALPGSKHVFSAAPGDAHKVGDTVDVGGQKYLKITATEYEVQ